MVRCWLGNAPWFVLAVVAAAIATYRADAFTLPHPQEYRSFQTQSRQSRQPSTSCQSDLASLGTVTSLGYRFRHGLNALSPAMASATTAVTTTMSPSVVAVYALVHIVLGALGTPIVAKATSTWYPKIVLPTWTPPNRIFGPVWTILYASMGVALSRIVSRLNTTWWQTPVMLWWVVHMLLNVSWAPIFFGCKRLRIGLAINYALLATLCGCILPTYFVLDRIAAALLVPYVLWLLFATALNQAICQRNPVTGKTGAYNNAMLQADLIQLQRAAAKYAGI
jgi:translocator protein